MRRALPFLVAFFVPSLAHAGTLTVGPSGTYATPCAAFAKAMDGDTIEIDAAGTYAGDVCAIARSKLLIKGVNGRPKIDAAGKNAQGKGDLGRPGDDTTIENVEMFGATVPDQNGAAIRQEGKNLTVRGSYLHHNEDGILAGDKDGSEILLELTELSHNGFGDGFSHNIYVNHVAKLTMRGCWSHDAKIGHLVKSRAAETYILYSRLTDQAGTASYELDVPNGGTTVVLGSLFHQSATTDNKVMISYGAEGANPKNPGTEIYVVHSTFVNGASGGEFVRGGALTTKMVLANDVFSGPGTITGFGAATTSGNFMGDPKLVDAAGFDFHLAAGSPCIDAGAAVPSGPISLVPTLEYVHPTALGPRASDGKPDQGAYEVGSGSAGAGGSGSGGSGTAGSGTAGSGTAGSGTAGSGTAGSGTAGSGTAGSGTAGSGTAGSATAGSGTAGSGTAGSATAGKAGSSATAGKAGSGGGTAGAGGSASAAATEEDDGGCGCRVVPKGPRGLAVVALLGLAIAARQRRRDP